jgi:hypothetical protein
MRLPGGAGGGDGDGADPVNPTLRQCAPCGLRRR